MPEVYFLRRRVFSRMPLMMKLESTDLRLRAPPLVSSVEILQILEARYACPHKTSCFHKRQVGLRDVCLLADLSHLNYLLTEA